MGWRADFLRGHLAENKAYGHHANFAKYCGSTTDELKIFARYQHGLALSSYWPDERIKSMAWSKAVVDLSNKNGIKNISTVGAPILYHDGAFVREQKMHKEFTLCVAPHSVLSADKSVFHSEEFNNHFPSFKGTNAIDYFAKLCLSQSTFQPKVLLYYKDYTKTIVSDFLSNGIEVTTLGDGLFDKRVQETYLDQTMSLLNSASEILLTDTNTLWSYGLYLKKPIKRFEESIFDENLARLNSYFKYESNVEHKIVYDLLGVEYRKSKEELYEIFGISSQLSTLSRRVTFLFQSAKNGLRKMAL